MKTTKQERGVCVGFTPEPQRSESEDPKEVLDRLAPRDQQQETANVHIEHYFPKGYDPDAEPWKSIKSHHYASLAAERQRTEELQEWLDNAQQTNLDLSDLHSELNRQLLSALAAIEKARESGDCPATVRHILMSIDLSALHKHDEAVGAKNWNEGYNEAMKSAAEVREPLVEALELMFQVHVLRCEQCSGPDDGCEEGQRLEAVKADALAKVKEQ